MNIKTQTKTHAAPKTWKARLGSFSKGVDNARTLNFSESGGDNCDDRCTMKAGACYAIHLEALKPSVGTSGRYKREQGTIRTCMAYIKALSKQADNSLPWIRFSSFGSVPLALTVTEAAVFAELLKQADRVGQHVHFPVETEDKRTIYEPLHASVVVRVSSQTGAAFLRALKAGKPASLVIKSKTGTTKRDNLAAADAFKKRANDPRVVVCPAIRATITKADKVKCGECTACAQADLFVLYPEH